MKTYAYIRVSTKEQNIERQLEALKEYNISEKLIYCDYQSGKDFNRPEYKKMKKKLKRGDLLIVKSIDRLGRNYDDILNEWNDITKVIRADIKVLDMELLDTQQSKNNLTGILISDLLLQLLAYVAQIEREFIKQRQAEGIAIAKRKGVKFGRKEKKMPDEFEIICKKCIDGKLSIRQAAKILDIHYSTFYRKYKIYRDNQ